MVCFASLAVLAIVFIWRFLPETKALPVEEIVKLFERSPLAPAAAQAEQSRR
jgi:MFS transporter, SP family, arabinose:H+ symporter